MVPKNIIQLREKPTDISSIYDKIIAQSEFTFYIQNLNTNKRTFNLILNTNGIINNNNLISKISIDFSNVQIVDVRYPDYLFYEHDELGNIHTYDDKLYPLPRSRMRCEFDEDTIYYFNDDGLDINTLPGELVYNITYKSDLDVDTIEILDSSYITDTENIPMEIHKDLLNPTFGFKNHNILDKSFTMVLLKSGIKETDSTNGTLNNIQMQFKNFEINDIFYPSFLLFRSNNYENKPVLK